MTTGELVKITNPDDIAAMPVEERGQLITAALQESKSWLAVATTGTDPTPIAEFKAWASTVAEMTRQKGLAEEIQLDALEMVRRAERGIGQSIRSGQAAGTIKTQRDGGYPTHAARRELIHDEEKKSPQAFLHSSAETQRVYAATDGITDDQHEEALAEARAEGNLSGANVVRKIQGVANGSLSTAEKLAKIAELADTGHTSKQIAPHVGVSVQWVRDLARKNNIAIPADKVTNRTRGIDPERVVQETVNTLQGVDYTLGLLTEADYDAFTADQIRDWLTALRAPMRAVRKLTKELNSRDHK